MLNTIRVIGKGTAGHSFKLMHKNAMDKFKKKLKAKQKADKEISQKEKLEDRFLGLSLYFNSFHNICNDTVLLPKQQRAKGGLLKKENPVDPENIPPDVLFPKQSVGSDGKQLKHEFVFMRDSQNNVIVDPTLYMQRAPIALDFTEYVRELKASQFQGYKPEYDLNAEDKALIKELLTPEYITEEDYF